MWYGAIPPLIISVVSLGFPSYIANFFADLYDLRGYKVDSFLENLGYYRDLDDRRIVLDWDALPDD